MGWLVYQMTGSAFLLGFVSFSTQIPSLVLSPVAGTLADRWNRHHILVVTQTLSMIQAFILAALVLTGNVAVWQVVVLGLFLGVVNSFDGPTRQSFTIDIVESKEDLGNAIALNSAMFNGARLIGPSVAGMLLVVVGEGVCFFLNGVSFLAVIGALLAMRLPPGRQATRHDSVWSGLKEGLRYAWDFPPIRALLLLVGCVSLVAMPYAVLMPIFASEILHGGPDSLGFLMAATGVGALAGAAFLASRREVAKLWSLIVLASFLFGIGLIGFSLSRTFFLSSAFLMVIGFGLMVQNVGANTLLQTIVEDDKRGRVMSLYMMSFLGMAPLGSLLAGSVAESIGAPATILIGGSMVIIVAAIFASRVPSLRQSVQPILARLDAVGK